EVLRARHTREVTLEELPRVIAGHQAPIEAIARSVDARLGPDLKRHARRDFARELERRVAEVRSGDGARGPVAYRDTVVTEAPGGAGAGGLSDFSAQMAGAAIVACAGCRVLDDAKSHAPHIARGQREYRAPECAAARLRLDAVGIDGHHARTVGGIGKSDG